MKDPCFMEPQQGDSSAPAAALATTLHNSIQALGRGFDVTSDIRLLYCKGTPGSRLVLVDEECTRNIELPDDGGDGTIFLSTVPEDVQFSMGKGRIERISVCSFLDVTSFSALLSSYASFLPFFLFPVLRSV